MKLMYLLATFAVVLVMMASCTRQSVTGYTLTAAIDGIPDGSHVQLFPVSHGHEKPVADTTVVDGKFIFKGVADEPLAVRFDGERCIRFHASDVGEWQYKRGG